MKYITLHKTLLGLLIASVAYSIASFVSAQNQNDELFDLVATQDALTAQDLSFSKFQSCEEMETVLEDYIKDNFKNNR